MTYQYKPLVYRYRPTPKAVRAFSGHEDLALHPGLSGMAIGLGVHIRSLPEGTPISVRTLVEQLPESEFEIAAALQELRDHGFLPKA
ncbi:MULTISPECIES: helix-turn-helix domain-containing protein [Streptomyces]|uniref:Helix-turn-helix domain-containing protein n=1 Tax=Streptomyces camelliae TaxID=3004093 RepID=A0ABY7P808_9ACTN|nr:MULTISPECIES: helix-turn-helix domain-containing protein [unclassified Streptomyces]WBO65659.1 helix-turn-helix domain-containing protein [Streptomyces sp. HUAS 2-6]